MKGAGTKEVEGAEMVLGELLCDHQAYLKHAYIVAAAFGGVGTVAFVWCVLGRATLYPRYVVFVNPAISAVAKKVLKWADVGAPWGLVLAGGCTNLWNALFFVVATLSL